MAHCPQAAPGDCAAIAPASTRLDPTLCFWIVGAIAYGGAAVNFAHGHFLDQISRDLWQHLAALKALIADPVHPANPFVPTGEPSRHFHPYWVATALVARAFDWNEWQALALAGFVSAAVLLTGVSAFGRAFYRDPWGPVALLAAMLLGWLVPVSHTGYHSLGTLAEGIGYPAALLIGLSFHLWALVIRALEGTRHVALIAPLAALMFATHPLGASIGFLVAGSFVVFWPGGLPGRRAICGAALVAGTLATSLWPYFNPIGSVFRTGNASWAGGVDFYSAQQLIAAFVPAAIGMVGLLHPTFRRTARPVLIALILLLGLFACGLAGVMIATRFIMPAVVLMHIGLGALLLTLARQWPAYVDWRRRALIAAGAFFVELYAILTFLYLRHEAEVSRSSGSAYEAALELTRDIPDDQAVAAYDVAVWPVVATGQRAASVPWPEPGIGDLEERRRQVELMFDPGLSREQRVAIARRAGVRVLVMDADGPLRRTMPSRLIETLTAQSRQSRQVGRLLRFDLY